MDEETAIATDTLRFLQLNCRKQFSVMSDLGECMRNLNVRIALVQEPCMHGLPRSMRVFKNPNVHDVRKLCAVVVDDVNLECMLVSDLSNEWGVCVCIKGWFGNVYFVSMYCRPREADIQPFLAYVTKVTQRLVGEYLVIGMDANAVSPMWHSKNIHHGRMNEVRGRVFEENFIACRLNVINVPSELYSFFSTRGTSDIDITLVNDKFDRDISSKWDILCEQSHSDHNLIKVECVMARAPSIAGRSSFRWSTRNANWEELIGDMSRLSVWTQFEYFESMSVNEKVDCLNKWVTEVSDRRLKRLKKVNPGGVVWFTDEIRRQRAAVGRLRSKFQRARRQGLDETPYLLRYREAYRSYKNNLKEAKNAHWRAFVTDEGNLDPWGKVYKLCRGKRGGYDVNSMKVGDIHTINWDDSVTLLLGEFFPSSPDEAPVLAQPEVQRDPLTRSEVNWAVYRGAQKKAPGLDGITGEIMRAIWAALPRHILSLYEQCLREGIFPDEWKVGSVVILLKSPEKARDDPRSYRPISLLPVMGKVLERMMVKRLHDKWENAHENQYGFALGKSTTDAWIKVKGYVHECVSKYVLGIFVDFKGAFDYLLWSKVLNRIQSLGCGEYKTWCSYFSNRKAIVKGVNGCVERIVTRGCPQGSIAGPAIWNLMVDDLLHTLTNNGCKVVAYADDLLLLVEGNSRAEIERLGREFMILVTAWGLNVGVGVSKDKTVCMLLKGKLDRKPIVRIDGLNVKHVTTVKYLGVNMGEGMIFLPHLNALRTKMANVVGTIRRVTRRDWGLNSRTLRILCKGLFESCMMYAAPVWHELVQFAYGRDEINRCQRIVLLASLRVCKTVSTDAMHVLMGSPPWDLVALRYTALYKYKKSIAFTDTDLITDAEVVGMGIDRIKTILDDKINNRWQIRWDESLKGRCTHEFIGDVRFVASLESFDFSLQLGYLLTGHGSLNKYLHGVGVSTTPECMCGCPDEDWKHILTECVMYEDLRDLHGMNVVVVGGVVNVSMLLSSRESFELANTFAQAVFSRRLTFLEEE